MKFIHCADVHLDTPLQGLAEYPGAPVQEIRNATRRAFEKVLEAAVSEKVDFLVIAGDLYDTGLKSFESALYFNAQMARLKEAGIDVYLIHGNHDAASKLLKQLRPPSNVHVFRSAEPQTFLIRNLRVALHGQSFATPEITDDLAAGYPEPLAQYFNIGVLHTNLSGISEHANYAPCSLDSLRNKGYQYWALGHVHNRQVLCENPYIVFPGNIQGRHGKEQGEKSCELVTVSESGAISLKSIATSVVPWTELDLDVSACGDAEEVYDKLRSELEETVACARDRVTAVRLRISGLTDAHVELNRDPEQVRHQAISLANEYGSGLLWIERVQVATLPRLDRRALLTRDDPVGEVVRMLDAMRADPALLAQLAAVEELRKKLPNELFEGTQPISFDSTTLAAALDEADGLLLARLSELEAV
ncbi:MAG: DNA repair exonuclease [Acidobacteria bacterium]|nr:DNA repair exonuclease [Acidobacteriota bacterium]MBV9436281.1 DNA repair exonuclease [Acidobacteriota bacterium]